VSDWALVWLATIAIALVATAVVQTLVALAALKAARQAAETMADLKREIRPLMDKVHRLADDAAIATAMATTQIERVDRMLTSLSGRVDAAIDFAQHVVIAPFQRGSMWIGALKAGAAFVRSLQQRRAGVREHHHHDEEDALFVG
jgi:hypothetical protein